jgi:bifunctional non-homologous end joining protein LigD
MRRQVYQPCIPTRGTKVPGGDDWLHEIKHDGYRLIVQREGKRVRLFTRNGYDWSDHYALIVEAALRIRKTSFVIDGEAVVLRPDGISDFHALRAGRRNFDVRLYALMDGGVDMRDEALLIRKLWLEKLLKRSGDRGGKPIAMRS